MLILGWGEERCPRSPFPVRAECRNIFTLTIQYHTCRAMANATSQNEEMDAPGTRTSETAAGGMEEGHDGDTSAESDEGSERGGSTPPTPVRRRRRTEDAGSDEGRGGAPTDDARSVRTREDVDEGATAGTRAMLEEICEHRARLGRVVLMYVPGHRGVSANEYADAVAKQHAHGIVDPSITFEIARHVRSRPCLYQEGNGLCMRYVYEAARVAANKWVHDKLWETLQTYRRVR